MMILVSTLYLNNEIASKITTIVTIITALIGAGALFIQYMRDKDINQASFVVEYAKYFQGIDGVNKLSALLDKYRCGEKECIKKQTIQLLLII